MRGPWPFPDPHGVIGNLVGATFGVGAIVFGIFAAAVVFVAIVALMILVLRFLLATTKAAELYVAERRAAVPAHVAVPASEPEPGPVVPDPVPAPVVTAPEPARAPRTATKTTGTAPRTRTPRTPRTPPST